MSDVQTRPAKSPARKGYGPLPTVAATWAISSRPIGTTEDGEQASPSTFSGTEAEVKAYCAERTAASQVPGSGPAREFLYRQD